MTHVFALMRDLVQSEAPMARTLLALSHITYTYPQAAEAALRDVSATFDAGWTAVIGDNGCGKTTLARIAC